MARRFDHEMRATMTERVHDTIQEIARARRVPVSSVLREAIDVYLATLAQEPAPTTAPTAQGTRSVSARATPWRGSAVMPRVIPGGRK